MSHNFFNFRRTTDSDLAQLRSTSTNLGGELINPTAKPNLSMRRDSFHYLKRRQKAKTKTDSFTFSSLNISF